MFRITLINMPFAALHLPSIALTQLKSVVESRYGSRVSVRVLNLNHGLANHLGAGVYTRIANSVDAVTSGLGDWFFRQVAFPELPDNAEIYFRRYLPDRSQQTEMMKQLLLARRRDLLGFLEGLIDKHGLDSSDLVGFTSMFAQNVACLALAKRLKLRKPKVVTVMGGANCETPMGEEIARQFEPIDFVFSGPSLQSFPELVGHLLDGEEEACHRLRGVFSRRKLAARAPGCAGEIGEELDIDVEIPLDYDSFFQDIDRSFPQGSFAVSIPFETSRGCWWGERAHCTFCGLNGLTMKFRDMSPDRALRQLESLFRYVPRASHFQSVDNIMPRNYLKEVFPHLRPPANVTIFYEVKADLKDREMEVLAKAGVREIQPGIESMATSTLALMKKGTTAFQNIRFLKSCLVHGVAPMWNLLVGFPGEEEEVYKKYLTDIPLLRHLPPPSGVYPVRFDRYSPYFTRAKEYGLDLRHCDFYELIYPFDKESLHNIAYYFVNQNVGAGYMTAMAKWIDEANALVRQWRLGWVRAEHGIRPQLTIEERQGSHRVIDSRGGKVVELNLSTLDLEVLAFLESPRKLVDVAARFADVDHFDAERQIASLRGHGLIFAERDLSMSLVVPDRSAAAARRPVAVEARQPLSPAA